MLKRENFVRKKITNQLLVPPDQLKSRPLQVIGHRNIFQLLFFEDPLKTTLVVDNFPLEGRQISTSRAEQKLAIPGETDVCHVRRVAIVLDEFGLLGQDWVLVQSHMTSVVTSGNELCSTLIIVAITTTDVNTVDIGSIFCIVEDTLHRPTKHRVPAVPFGC